MIFVVFAFSLVVPRNLFLLEVNIYVWGKPEENIVTKSLIW